MQSCKDRLVEDNLKLVYFIFGKLRQNSMTRQYKEDLVSDGMLGLVKAAKGFDEGKGYKFATFATTCIRNEILLAIRRLNKFANKEVSLYAPIGLDSEGGELCLADILEDNSALPDKYFEAQEVEDFISKQKPIDKKIAAASLSGFTQREISAQLYLSQSYISRRLRNLKGKLIASSFSV